jgi:predicted branched-subunit amino acid permease
VQVSGISLPIVLGQINVGLAYGSLALCKRFRTATASPMHFVYVHNAGRSQATAAHLAHFAGERVEVRRLIRTCGHRPPDQ